MYILPFSHILGIANCIIYLTHECIFHNYHIFYIYYKTHILYQTTYPLYHMHHLCSKIGIKHCGRIPSSFKAHQPTVHNIGCAQNVKMYDLHKA